jgi:hypothetical protein
MSDQDILPTLIPLFQKLSQDDQDSVRLLTVEILVALAKRLDEEKRRELLLPAFTTLSNDKAWRVRYMVASKYVEVYYATVHFWYPEIDLYYSLLMHLDKILHEKTLQEPL